MVRGGTLVMVMMTDSLMGEAFTTHPMIATENQQALTPTDMWYYHILQTPHILKCEEYHI